MSRSQCNGEAVSPVASGELGEIPAATCGTPLAWRASTFLGGMPMTWIQNHYRMALCAAALAACGGRTVDETAVAQPTPVPASSCEANDDSVNEWFVAGGAPQKYAERLDGSVSCSGHTSWALSSTSATDRDFGTLMRQRSDLGPFAGRRVRISGYVRTAQVDGWAGLWMRVDGSPKTTLAFDNMQSRPITGTSDWAKYEVVLDVASNATQLSYGVLLSSAGTVWLDGVKLETVDTSVPVTGH
jgi:hypothetical protein